MRFSLGNPGALPSPNAAPSKANVGSQQPGVSMPVGYSSPPGGNLANPPGYALAGPEKYESARVNDASREKSTTAETARTDTIRLSRLPQRQSRFQMFLLAGVSAVALAAAAFVIWYKVTNKNDTLPTDIAARFKELNLSFEAPPSPWVRDEDTRALLGSPYILVYKRDNPEAYLAFGAKDFDTRSPRESELLNGTTQALNKILDLNSIRKTEELDKTWMGQAVKGFKFYGQLKTGNSVAGEAYRFANKGIGYWFLSWTGDNNIYEEMQPSFAEARRHCKLLDLRDEWKEKYTVSVPFKGDKVSYTILDGEGVWEEEKEEANVKFEGAECDKILKIKRGKKRDEIQDARLIVYILNGGGDPITEARQYVTNRRMEELKRAGDFHVDFVEITSAPEGDAIAPVVDTPLPVLRLKSIVPGAESQNRFHAISAIKIGEKTVLVHAYCSLEKKETLENTFIQIAGSLHGN
jgi:hypothetical protein